MNYRERLYRQYRASLPGSDSVLTSESLRYQVRAFEALLGPWLPVSRAASLFEMGCGQGIVLYFLKQRGYTDISGMDQEPGHVAAAKKLGLTNVSSGDAVECLQRKERLYDCIIAIDVLEHFTKEELFPLLDNVRESLRPGGVFLWRAPNADGLFSGRLRYGDLTHEIAFTRSSAYQLMCAAGFTDIDIKAEPVVVTGLRSSLRWILWKIMSSLAKLYLFVESYAQKDVLLSANLLVRARKS